ncbi:MAG: hypothetical protein C0604_02630 [Clostridiales bacterium]|nr:MAG: hypothetical protein C0604_02630 [Clostridiales bacterium]
MERRYRISKLKGEFINKEIEKEYSLFYTEKTIPITRRIIMIVAFMNFLFILPDYFTLANTELFVKVIFYRCVFFIGFLIFYRWFDYSDNYADYFKGLTLMELFAISSFLHIYWIYQPVNFLIQTMGLFLAMVVLVTIHNRWIYVLIVKIFMITGFLAITLIGEKEPDVSIVLAVTIYSVLTASFLLFRDYEINVYKRRQYERSMALEEISMKDFLTGALNRGAFENELEKALERWQRHGSVFSIVMFDVDDFKTVNDTHGHMEGDLVLKELSEMVIKETRKIDVFARWGGEEFVMILPETDTATTLKFVERLRTKIKGSSFGKVNITCSFGVTQIREGDTRESIFSRMDKYLYLCKRRGKDMVYHDFEKLLESDKQKI